MKFNLNRADEMAKVKANSFLPIDLNEGNVRAIFERCLATEDIPKEKVSRSILFSRTLGYQPEDEIVFYFDKDKLLDNKKNIEYFFGQLKNAHEKSEHMRMEDAFYQYQGRKWTDNRAKILELLYLGCTNETDCISPFDVKTDAASLAVERLKPHPLPQRPGVPGVVGTAQGGVGGITL